MKSAQIGSWTFPSKKSCEDKCREIWAEHPGRDMVPVTDPQHVKFIRALLAEHPDVEEKTSRGVTGFSVGTNKGNTRCFYINYEDGTWDDFSWKPCFDAAAKNSNSG